MLMIIAAALGALIGAFRAHRAGGNSLDMLQYAAAHAIAFAVITLIIGIFGDWQGWF